MESKPTGPYMDVVAPPPVDKKPGDDHFESDTTKKQPQKASEPKPPRQPGSGVGLAIFATVVVVLGLAAMATYAYFQTIK